MSRVGKEQIKVPTGVSVEFDGAKVVVSGNNGKLEQEIKSPITVAVENGEVKVNRGNDSNQAKALHGLYNRLIQNMITGVSKGFTRTLILNGVGYKVAQKGEGLVLNIGYSHPVEIKGEQGIKFKICTPAEIQALNLGKDGIAQVIQVMGMSKERVGAVASNIRAKRVVEPYHLYGIRYSDEKVQRKESKSGAKKK